MEVDLSSFQGECNCGKIHHLQVEKVYIGKGIINQLENFLEEKQISSVSLICDTNTYYIAEEITKLLSKFTVKIILLEAKGLHADEKATKYIEDKVESEGLLAVGSGTIHDLTRFMACKKGLSFIAIPTAASVDGFVSTVCAMTENGFKITYPGVSPIAVFADTQYFSKAPWRLTVSGIADLLGKYTALLDWKVAHLLINEYICDKVVAIEEEVIEKVAQSIDKLLIQDEESYEQLMYALILSGLAMQMVGNSRPASGAEHHLAHLWEMHIINEELDALHGEKVGVALGIVCDAYKKLLTIDSLESKVNKYQGIPEKLLKEKFGELYRDIVRENIQDPLKKINPRKLEKCFKEIQVLIESLPTGEKIRKILNKLHGKGNVEDIGLQESLIRESIGLSPYVRQRLTLMRVMKLINEEN